MIENKFRMSNCRGGGKNGNQKIFLNRQLMKSRTLRSYCIIEGYSMQIIFCGAFRLVEILYVSDKILEKNVLTCEEFAFYI